MHPMTDLNDVLPNLDLTPWRHLLFSLEKNDISVSELISLDPVEIIRRCPLPIRDLRGLIDSIIEAIHDDLIWKNKALKHAQVSKGARNEPSSGSNVQPQSEDELCIKTLDPAIDMVLGGGIYTKHITEIVGESAVGKTQFALNLLLSVQLPPPRGLGKSAIYISTESPLSTRRLAQILSSNPQYQACPSDHRPTLDKVHAIEIRDLEVQEHIIQYQIPVAIKQYDAGLLVIDSIAANYRSEFATGTIRGLADRAVELTRLGSTLKRIAKQNNLAIVVTNQVSDRFDDVRTNWDRLRMSSPMIGSSPTSGSQSTPISSSAQSRRDRVMSLDYQQRYFTGWGNEISSRFQQLKTPAMGVVWTNQISTRVVLKMGSVVSSPQPVQTNDNSLTENNKRRRSLAVVFAPWIEPTFRPIEYELHLRGPVSLPQQKFASNIKSDCQFNKEEYAELLNPKYWIDGTEETDNEFP